MWFIAKRCNVFLPFVVLIASYEIVLCDTISNTSFNANLRDYSSDGGNNTTHMKTLQKEELGKNAYYVPASTPIKFKEISDSALSSSSHSRGLAYHDHSGFSVNDYEEGPHYDLGHDYDFHEGHSPHGIEPHDYDPHHYGGYGYYKHHKHALATKALLWPLAGIALIGAAAALVSNPILLQLGVVSGKRRRRDTEEITGPDYSTGFIKNYGDKITKFNNEAKIKIDNTNNDDFKRRILKTNQAQIEIPIKENNKRRVLPNNRNHAKRSTGVKGRPSVKSYVPETTTSPDHYEDSSYDDKFIPIAIKLRSPKIPQT